MRTKRVELEAEIIRRARTFVEACGDGLGLAADPDAYMAWHNCSQVLAEYDGLIPDDIATRAHVANLDGPDTEHGAAELIVPNQWSIRYDLLMQYRISWVRGWSKPGAGLTDSEMEFLLKKAHTTVSSARNWLMNAGWVHDSGDKRRTPSRRPAIIWSLTPAGLKALDVAAAA